MAKQKTVAFDDLFSTGGSVAVATKPAELSELPTQEETIPIIGPPAKPSRKFIIYSKQIDKYNILRRRVLLTPAVCDQCGLDLGEMNGLGTYDEMENDIKSKITRTVAKHKEEYHTKADDMIVDEDQIPKEFFNRGH